MASQNSELETFVLRYSNKNGLSRFMDAISNSPKGSDHEIALYSRTSVLDYFTKNLDHFGITKSELNKLFNSFHISPSEFQIFTSNDRPGFYASQSSGFLPFLPENAEVTFTWDVVGKSKSKKNPLRDQMTLTSINSDNRIYSAVYEKREQDDAFYLARLGISYRSGEVSPLRTTKTSNWRDGLELGAITQRMIEKSNASGIRVINFPNENGKMLPFLGSKIPNQLGKNTLK